MLANLLEPLEREGFDIRAVYFQERARSFIPPRFVSYPLIKHVGSFKYYFEYPRVIFGLAAILRQEQPSLILCNAYQPFWLCLIAKIIAGCAAPIITGEQNNLTRMFHGAKWGRLRSLLTRLLDPLAHRIIVPSQGLKEHLIADFQIRPEAIDVIVNPIPLEQIRQLAAKSLDHPWFKTHDRPILLNVGVLDDQKDQKTLLRAFALVRHTFPVRCVFVGDGPLLDTLKDETQSLGVAEDVSFLGFQDNPFQFMAKSDVFVLSSRYEGFGLVLAEAMACGCPIVSTRCPYGPEEIITDGRDGLLSPVGDAQALADNILKILSDAPLRRTLIQNGYARAETFDEKAIAVRYAQTISSCLTPGAKL